MARYFVWSKDRAGIVYRVDENDDVWYKSKAFPDWRVSGWGDKTELLGPDEEDLTSGEMIEIEYTEVN